jgi:N-acetyl-gamma-glutamyl-phosphate reductase
MQKIAGLARTPIFNPYICDFYAGMTVSVPVYADSEAVFAALSAHYEKARFVKVLRAPEDGFIPATGNTGTNLLTIYVCGDAERTTAISLLDNLGKGASGAAVQNMNIMLGIPEDTSL